MNTDRLFRTFCHLYRDGTSLAAALRLEEVPESSYYAWRKDNQLLDTEMRSKAQVHVVAEIDLARVRAERIRETRQQKIEKALLDGISPVVKKLLEAAESTGTVHEQIAVLRELRQWLSDGVLDNVVVSAAEPKQLLPPSLPDFLSGQVSKIVAESPSGDRVTVERGRVIEGTSEMPAPPPPPSVLQ